MPTTPLARLSKAYVSLLVLAATVAGLPLLLAWATPVIWAATHDDLTHLFDRQDTGSVFLLVLVAVGWIGWAQFTFCALRELASQLRGRQWHAPRGLGTSQRAAALLVGSILVLLPTNSALASDAHAATTATAAHSPGHTPAVSQDAAPDEEKQSASRDTEASYTVREVRPAESLWSIAERQLGDGERWREIADLNEGHTMADGQVFRSNSFLQPGWTLAMPASNEHDGLRTQNDGQVVAENGGQDVVTVHAGDSLSKIAEDELGHGSAWPALFDASKGKEQPDGLPAITDPDLIYAGQHVTVPAARLPSAPAAPGTDQGGDDSEGTSPSASPTRHESKPTGDRDQDDEAPRSTPSPHSTAPDPQSPVPASPEPTADRTREQTVPPAPADTTDDPAAPASSPLSLRTVLGAGALLAAAVTAALALRRTLQRRRRKPGETIAISAETSAAEAQLAAAGEPSTAARLDAALRTMVSAAERDGRDVPVLRAARLEARGIHVLPDDLASEPPLPFAPGTAGWWRLPDNAELLAEDEARTVPAPQPALVTVGTTAAGDLVLADLARLPALLLDGNPVHITEFCTSLALELGMSLWGADVEIVAVGFGEDLPNLLPTSRIAHMRHPEHALRDLTERLLEVHQMPETAHHPYVVLCAAALDDDTAWQFADILGKDLPIPATLIAPTGTTSRHFPDADILAVSAPAPRRFDSLGVDITVQRLDHDAYQQIVSALAVSAQPAHEAEGPWQHVPGEPAATAQEAAPPLEASTDDRAAPAPAGTVATGAVDAVFPALLTASADPAAPPVLSGHAAEQGDDEGAQATEMRITADQDVDVLVSDSAIADAGDRAGKDRGPEVRVLGPVSVDGVDPNGHGPRSAQLAALLYFRPGRTADAVCADMDPLKPWSTATLNARLQYLRRALGNDPAGDPYVPRRRTGDTPYRLADGVRCDWTRFLQLAEHALPRGADGLAELEEALSLVRGLPFGSQSPAWAAPYQQEMITRITDVAHSVATHRTRSGPHQDLAAARAAIVKVLDDVDGSAELLYRDLMLLEWTAGNRSALLAAITRTQQVTQALDCDLELETEQLIGDLLKRSASAPRPEPDPAPARRPVRSGPTGAS
ncbi:LysM peptidoglycan-binding domain-containing protein [Streptomyces sp. NPDC060235]|uniref:LysM peptidoglycan-binding domain-containing protein n=1 Tax=Streptomyces sp. NPDC060235 TaxID=3347080 RepID=UPI0036699141